MNNKVNLGLKYSGRFKAEVLKDNEVVRESCWSDNIVVNNYLNNLASGSGNTNGFGSVAVGTGTTEPAATDSALVNQLASTNNGVDSTEFNQISTVPYYSSSTYTFLFNIGAVSGNLTEVAAFTFTGGIASRALFRDEFGDPTSVTVLSDEQLRITYEMRLAIPDQDVLATVSGYDLTIRASNADNTNSWFTGGQVYPRTNNATAHTGGIVAIDSTPTGGNARASSFSAEPYVSNSFQREVTYTWDTTSANYDVASFRLFGGAEWQVGVSPVIPKTSNDLLSLTVIYSFGRP